MVITMNDFEQYIQKDMDESRAEQMWDNKSKSFYERTEKTQEQFVREFVFTFIKERKLLNAVPDGICWNFRHTHRILRELIFLQTCLPMQKKNSSISLRLS